MTGIKTIPKKKAVSRQSLEAFVQKTYAMTGSYTDGTVPGYAIHLVHSCKVVMQSHSP